MQGARGQEGRGGNYCTCTYVQKKEEGKQTIKESLEYTAADGGTHKGASLDFDVGQGGRLRLCCNTEIRQAVADVGDGGCPNVNAPVLWCARQVLAG